MASFSSNPLEIFPAAYFISMYRTQECMHTHGQIQQSWAGSGKQITLATNIHDDPSTCMREDVPAST